jgi:Poly(ADP-ribose) polymerase catalytic domain
MPNATVHEIMRIQNRVIWNKYQTEINNFQSTKGQAPIVRMLYHGTRQTNPSLLFSGREGFDMRYSPGGMWGIANYFAANASYSDAYHHPAANSMK